MDEQRFLDCLEADYTRLRAVAADALDAPVPTCPGWTGADLVRHVTEVYLHKTETMRQGSWPAPWPPALPGAPLDELDAAYQRLVSELAAEKRHDPIPVDLAEDGIEELLVCFLAYASAEYPDELAEHLIECDGRTVQIATESAGWQVQLGPTEITVERGHFDAESGVSAEAGAVLRWLWRRAGDGAVHFDGNRWVTSKLRMLLGATTQ